MKKRFTDEQIVRILQESEQGMATKDVCRKHNISEQTFYRWKAKYAGLQVSDVTRLKALERENEELKKMVAEQALDIRMLRDVNSKKVVSLPERRRAVMYLTNTHGVSERKACQVMSINRSTYRHQGVRQEVDPVVVEVVRLSERYPYWGYRKVFDLIDREKFPVGRERVRLIRRREGLQVRRKRRKKRVLGQTTQWVHRATHPNHVWSYDFVHDLTTDGRSLRFLTIVDECTREGLSVECGRSLTSQDVVRVLGKIIRQRGAPRSGPRKLDSAISAFSGYAANLAAVP